MIRTMRSAVFFLGSLFLTNIASEAVSQSLPKVKISGIRQVFHNGEHNAFTDLVRFQDHYYLTFRSCPDGHMVHPTASIIILRSRDLKQWDKSHQFRVAKRDTRDPHLLVFKNRLFVYTGTWYSGESTLPRGEYDLNLHLGYGVSSEDGDRWTEPFILEGTFGHYVWRATTDGEKAYLCGRRKKGFDVRPKGEGPEVESAMLESDDGVNWKTRSLFQNVDGDETAFQFEPKGDLLAVARRGNKTAELLRSKRPYLTWSRTELDRYIGGPLLIRWGEHWVVGGRKNLGKEGPKTSLCWLDQDKLSEFAELPSGGDNSYPGIVPLSPERAVVSWYSSHEKDDQGKVKTAIYMADLLIE